MRVLIVDDEDEILDLISVNLALSGIDVDQAHNGEEALLLAHQRRPDCVLLDVMMPGLDGLEVCRLLRADAAARDAAIIIVSARADPDHVEAARQAGADDFVAKPFNPFELEPRIAASVRRRREHRL